MSATLIPRSTLQHGLAASAKPSSPNEYPPISRLVDGNGRAHVQTCYTKGHCAMFKIAYFAFLASAATAPLGLLVREWPARTPTLALLAISLLFAGIGYMRKP
jgi:hypothetical protein